MPTRPRHLRARLTIWYVTVLACLLIVAWAGTSFLMFYQLRNQLDRFSIEEIETAEGLLSLAPNGQLRMNEDYHNHPESKDAIESFVEVLSTDGEVLFRNGRLGNRTLDGLPFPGEGVGGYSARSIRLSDGTAVRLVSRAHVFEGRRILIRLGHSEQPLWSRLKELWTASLLVLPVMLAAAGFAGYVLARRALRPIERMTRRAREITPEKLHERLPIDDPADELGQLALVFNETLARLEAAFEQLRRFTSDASHELRTPLASIRSVGEVGLQRDGSRAEYRDTIGSMLEEVNRLTSLVDNLLTISRADAGRILLQRARIRVMDLAGEAAALMEILMEEKSQRLLLTGDERAMVEGDRLFLRQALVNILHNAVKYSPLDAEISVRVRQSGETVVVEVEDHGPGIPEEDRARVFDRFYRVDKARWRESGGAGLGLSIVKWAVEAHSGEVGLESLIDGGCLFRVVLPAARRGATDTDQGTGATQNPDGQGGPRQSGVRDSML